MTDQQWRCLAVGDLILLSDGFNARYTTVLESVRHQDDYEVAGRLTEVGTGLALGWMWRAGIRYAKQIEIKEEYPE